MTQTELDRKLRFLADVLDEIETARRSGDFESLLHQYKDLTEQADSLHKAVESVRKEMHQRALEETRKAVMAG